MAKRQQQADFLPSKALQPQQQIFDQYNAPKQFRAPQSELMEIGSALAGLSPTLKKFAEKDRAEDAARMELAVSKMSIEELRAASKRDFIGLQKKGVIPEGASPWAKVALLEASGKRLAGEARAVLYAKLPELSQLDSTLTVDQVLQEFSAANGIDSIYAAKAYNDAIQPIKNAFTNRVGEAIAQRTVQQNSDNLVDNLSEALMGIQFDDSEGNQATWSNATELIDAHRLNTGAPGHKELFEAAEVRYLELLELTEDEDHANIFLAQLSELQIGTASFGHTYRNELTELKDDGLTKLEGAARRKRSLTLDKKNDLNDKVNTEMSEYWLNLEGDDKSADPFGEKSEAAIMAALAPRFTSADGTVDTEELNKATIAGMEYVAGLQRQQTDEVDWEISAEYLRLAYNPNIPPSLVEEFRKTHGDKISPSYKASVDRESVETRKLTELLPGLEATTLIPLMGDLDAAYDALDLRGKEFRDEKRKASAKVRDKWRTIAMEEAKKMGAAAAFEDPTTLITNINARFGPWMDKQIESVIPVEKPVGDLTTSFLPPTEGDVTGGVQALALTKSSKDDPRPEQLEARTRITVWDSKFTHIQEDYQAIAKDTTLKPAEQVEKLQELGGKLWSLAKEKYDTTLKVYTQKPDFDFVPGDRYSWVSTSDFQESVRAKSIVLMATLTELQNTEPGAVEGQDDKVVAKWSGDTYKETLRSKRFGRLEIIEKGGGHIIPIELLNPRHAVFVSDGNEKPLESAEALSAFRLTPEGEQHLSDIYDALILANPDAKVGFKQFYEFQYNLLKGKRP